MKRLIPVLTLFSALSVSADAFAEGWGTIKGKVVWSGGAIPVGAKLEVTKDQPWCVEARNAKGLGPILDEALVVNEESKAIKNLFVYMNVRTVPPIHPDYPQTKDDVAKADAQMFAEAFGVEPSADALGKALADKKLKLTDLPKASAAGSGPVVIDQLYCQYAPHAIALREGQKALVLNYEEIAHNVKVSSFLGNESNLNMPPNTFLFYDWVAENNPLSIQCSIHGWMQMYAMVFKHPYFDVTGNSGEFELKNVPAGEVELTIRSPKYILGGRNKYKLTVNDGETVELLVKYDGEKGTVEKQ